MSGYNTRLSIVRRGRSPLMPPAVVHAVSRRSHPATADLVEARDRSRRWLSIPQWIRLLPWPVRPVAVSVYEIVRAVAAGAVSAGKGFVAAGTIVIGVLMLAGALGLIVAGWFAMSFGQLLEASGYYFAAVVLIANGVLLLVGSERR